MKDHSGQSRFFTELRKFFQNDTVLTGAAIGQRHNKIEVLIFVPQKASQLVLGLLPFPQNIGKRFRQPHLADTEISLWFFQDQPCAGVRHKRSKDIIDILLAQGLYRPLGGPCQFLFDIDIGIVSSNFFIGDVDIAPGQTHDLAHAHGTGKGQIHRHIEFAVRTLVQGGADHIGGPNVPLLVFHFG